MATLSSSSTQLCLLTFLFLLLLIHVRLNLDPSDLQRRLSNNSTYVLRITRLIFKSHQLDGFLSPALGRLAKLKEISLAHNNLIDKIPSQIVDCRKLEILNLGDNRFSEKLPQAFSNLEGLSIADNFFSGKIPASIHSFRNLQLFNFAGNKFLNGSLPTMKIIKISATNVPKRYVLAKNTSTKGNNNTTVAANAQAPTNTLAPGPSATPKQKKNNKKVGGWLLGFFAGALAGRVSGFIFSLLFKLLLVVVKGVGKDGGPAIFSSMIKRKKDLAFLEKEDSLVNLEFIGWRGGGDVYKAEHRNLVPLLAHVSRPDCHYLVYEFMKNGNLKDMLNQVANGTRQLDCLTRHNIALGVATGLEYLHMDNTPQIIHGALGATNILLDGDMEAWIADFGHAKAMPNGQTHISISYLSGTVSIIAPEYHQTMKFTDMCDIYCSELLSDEFFQNTNEMSLVKWMRNVMTSENPKQAIDVQLMGNKYEAQMLLVLKIACFCTLDNLKERLTSKDVRCMLAQIKH
ncbi:unnamed protein product [Malus baccata var. baccata]